MLLNDLSFLDDPQGLLTGNTALSSSPQSVITPSDASGTGCGSDFGEVKRHKDRLYDLDRIIPSRQPRARATPLMLVGLSEDLESVGFHAGPPVERNATCPSHGDKANEIKRLGPPVVYQEIGSSAKRRRLLRLWEDAQGGLVLCAPKDDRQTAAEEAARSEAATESANARLAGKRRKVARLGGAGLLQLPRCTGKFARLAGFRREVVRMWWRAIRRRSQRHRRRWDRFASLVEACLPRRRILHPYPAVRFAAKHPR